MKIKILTNKFWIAIPSDLNGIEITDEQYAGLLAGTHRISDDSKSVVEKTASELQIEQDKKRIAECKALLTATDYQSHKHADGAMSFEDYAPIAVQRQDWRDEINALEAEIAALEEQEETTHE